MVLLARLQNGCRALLTGAVEMGTAMVRQTERARCLCECLGNGMHLPESTCPIYMINNDARCNVSVTTGSSISLVFLILAGRPGMQRLSFASCRHTAWINYV